MAVNARIPDAYQEFQSNAADAFNFTGRDVGNFGWSPGPSTPGSTFGVPPSNYIAGMEPQPGPGGQAYANTVLQRPAGSHPVLWSIILFMGGIVLLGYVAHAEVRRRG